MNGQADVALNDCGCCEGLTVETPAAIGNRPGLAAIAYRVGTHGQFKASMLARLSQREEPKLGALKTREDDDFTIALIDAFALVSDVIAFYQERIANESYLRTATERGSIVNLARLIGYQLRPGVAASTYLAFTLETGPGAPAEVTIGKAVRTQSIPGPDEKPQSFETIESIIARPEWNALKPRLTQLRFPGSGDTGMYLAGVTTNLKPGDSVLIVGPKRVADATSEDWDVRRVASLEPDAASNRTLVRWTEALRIARIDPPKQGPVVYAFRLQASLFGFNAPAWAALPVALRIGEINPNPTSSDRSDLFLPGAYAGRKDSWADARFASGTTAINLDAPYNQLGPDSWIVLSKPTNTTPAYAELYGVTRVGQEAQADFNISAKTTRLEIAGENIDKFSRRDTTVLAQSEALELAETPIEEPLSGDGIVLDRLVEGLAEGRTLIVTGKRIRAVIGSSRTRLYLVAADALRRLQLNAGDNLTVLSPLPDLKARSGAKLWHLRDRSGFDGYLTAPAGKVTLAAAEASDAMLSEVVSIREVSNQDLDHTVLTLVDPLRNVYDRATVTIFGNVAPATHGETVPDEVLGSGDASQPYQRFALRQSPLTFTAAATPSGGETTLEVRVNDLKWTEVPTLFGRGPRERVYVARVGDDQRTTIEFGDGWTGARLPMGRENVKASYRKGIGLDGLVDAGQLSLLMTRLLGVKSVTNPLPAAGAQDPQSLADARANSPLTVLTLDRIVSLRDYEDFARAFSGIAKALATWTWNGHSRGVFLTVAGIGGAEVAGDSVLHGSLLAAIQAFGSEFIPVKIESYRGVPFRLVATVKIDAAAIEANVLAAVEAALRSSFSFAARTFGQPVTLSEVFAVMQNVPGVVAVDINKLYRGEAEALSEFLPAQAPLPGDDAGVPAAELLTLDTGPLELGTMP
jgi:hypothetical protein